METLNRNFETYIFEDFDHEMNYCVQLKDMIQISKNFKGDSLEHLKLKPNPKIEEK